MKRVLITIIGVAFLLGSCEWFDENDVGLSDDELIEGLKTALIVGTDSSSTALSIANGYYGDALVKIPLPEEAELLRSIINGNSVLKGVSSTIGLDNKFEDVIKAVNHAAEDAANDAAPIFKDAITNLNISQGLEILNGQVPSDAGGMKSSDFDSTAATQYLKGQTFNLLSDAYSPKVNASLGKDIVGNVSAVEAWEALTTTYNSFLSYKIDIGFISYSVQQYSQTFMDNPLPAAINTDLGEFSTQLALDGLFLKVGVSEKKIRRDPWQWISSTVGSILTKVFG